MTTEIETVTVDFDQMRWDADRYLRLRKTKRLVITRGGEEILVLGPWLPGEKRTPAPEGFLDELHRPLMDPDDPELMRQFLAYLRGDAPST
jgi:hypothetical protein